MRSSPLFVLFLFFIIACDSADAKTGSLPISGPAPPSADWPAVRMIAPERVRLIAGRTTKVHVEVPNRAAIGSVLVIDATKTPFGATVEQAVIGQRDTGVDVFVHLPELNFVDGFGRRLELSISSTRGIESSVGIEVEIAGAPGTLARVDDITLGDVRGISLSPDGDITVCGAAYDQAALVRVHAKGNVDTAFGSFGSARIFPRPDPGDTSVATAVAEWSDGSLAVGGWFGHLTFADARGTAFVVRMNADGIVDGAFSYVPPTDRSVVGLAVDAADRVVVAYEGSSAVEIVALTTAGTVVQTGAFPPSASGLPVASVVADAARRIHVAFGDGTVVRLAPDLSVEETKSFGAPLSALAFRPCGAPVFLRGETIDAGEDFETDGSAMTAFRALAVQPDEKLVAAGRSLDGRGSKLARFWLAR